MSNPIYLAALERIEVALSRADDSLEAFVSEHQPSEQDDVAMERADEHLSLLYKSLDDIRLVLDVANPKTGKAA